MQDDVNITDESLVETELSAPAATGETAVSNVDGLTLEELNSQLGKQFPNKEAALKSIKDTYSYVGKKATPAPAQVDPNQFVSRQEFEEATFYAAHPEYSSQKEIISALAAKNGQSVSQVVESDTFKTVFSKVKTADELEASKSVLHSNPRLGQVTDKMAQAQEAHKAGNATVAADAATSAVIDAFGLK